MFRSEGLEVERLPANWVGTAARLLAYFRLSCLLIDVASGFWSRVTDAMYIEFLVQSRRASSRPEFLSPRMGAPYRNSRPKAMALSRKCAWK